MLQRFNSFLCYYFECVASYPLLLLVLFTILLRSREIFPRWMWSLYPFQNVCQNSWNVFPSCDSETELEVGHEWVTVKTPLSTQTPGLLSGKCFQPVDAVICDLLLSLLLCVSFSSHNNLRSLSYAQTITKTTDRIVETEKHLNHDTHLQLWGREESGIERMPTVIGGRRVSATVV